MNRSNYLNISSESTSEEEYPNFGALLGYTVSGETDLRLLREAYPRKLWATEVADTSSQSLEREESYLVRAKTINKIGSN
jgi:hypothetical protein